MTVSHQSVGDFLPTGRNKKGVLGVGSISAAKHPFCQYGYQHQCGYQHTLGCAFPLGETSKCTGCSTHIQQAAAANLYRKSYT